MANDDKAKAGVLVLGGTLGAVIATLLARRPVEAAPPNEKTDYIIALLEQLAQGNVAIVALLEQILVATGVAPPGIEVTVRTPWVAKEPEQIYSYAIRTIGTFYSDKMVDWTRGKRLLIKVESSLNVACQVQVIGNFVDDMNLASDINAPINVGADENHSIGLAWDDYHPFIGLRITTAVAPTAGILTIWAVVQE